MKPGVVRWAINNTYIGGGAIGQPTKAPATAGQEADGYYPDILVAPQIWNYERWAAMLKAHEAGSIRVLNWELTDVTAGFAGSTRGDGFYDATTLTNIFTQVNAGGVNFEAHAVGGLIYAVCGFPAAVIAGALPRLADDVTGGMVQTSALPAILPQYCAGACAGWATPGAWVLPGTWNTVAHDHVGTWVFGDTVGGSVALTTGPLVAMAAAVTPPGFVAGPINDIIHSHHPAGTVYPNDPGNNTYMAITLAGIGLCECSTSTDGNIWTLATQPFATIPRRLAYSAYGTRWVAAQRSNTFARSDDNGLTWGNYPLPVSVLGIINMCDIACDGFGDWVIVQTDGTSVQVMASWDNAETFHHVFMVSAPAVANICVWYGGGRFHLIVDDAVGAHVGFTSLRGGDV